MPPQAPGQWTQQSQPVRPQVQQQAPAPAPQPVQPIHQVQQVQQAHPPPQPPLQPQPQQIQPDKPSNVDLLSSLMDDPLGISHLPAPLTPSQSSTTRVVTVLDGPGPGETTNLPPPLAPNNAVSKCSPQEPTPAVVTTTQPLQHSAPTPQQVHSELSTPQLSVPEPSVFEQPSEPKVEPQPRPSASVLPIIQPSQSSSSLQSVEQHTLSMSTVTSVNYVAQPSEKTDKEIDNRNSMDLSSLLNPATFQIGPSDDTRFQKRLARNQFNQPLPPLDPSDPLNKLDANFFRKS
uniref:Uncharacterized protein n=1 Tax=Steinernema glaseri TaxID=37863 RepID=A0A1I7YK65_9BILA